MSVGNGMTNINDNSEKILIESFESNEERLIYRLEQIGSRNFEVNVVFMENHPSTYYGWKTKTSKRFVSKASAKSFYDRQLKIRKDVLERFRFALK